jgi:hypothetical protein
MGTDSARTGLHALKIPHGYDASLSITQPQQLCEHMSINLSSPIENIHPRLTEMAALLFSLFVPRSVGSHHPHLPVPHQPRSIRDAPRPTPLAPRPPPNHPHALAITAAHACETAGRTAIPRVRRSTTPPERGAGRDPRGWKLCIRHSTAGSCDGNRMG